MARVNYEGYSALLEKRAKEEAEKLTEARHGGAIPQQLEIKFHENSRAQDHAQDSCGLGTARG